MFIISNLVHENYFKGPHLWESDQIPLCIFIYFPIFSFRNLNFNNI